MHLNCGPRGRSLNATDLLRVLQVHVIEQQVYITLTVAIQLRGNPTFELGRLVTQDRVCRWEEQPRTRFGVVVNNFADHRRDKPWGLGNKHVGQQHHPTAKHSRSHRLLYAVRKRRL